MVSIRRRKLKGPSNGKSSSLVPFRGILRGGVPGKPDQSGRPVNKIRIPSVDLQQPVKASVEMEMASSPPAKRQKIHVQVDPENPMEVHTYLMKLKEDNKFDTGPLLRSEEMSVKEWMEKCYPHIFRVFPQNPRVLQIPDQSKRNDFLYCDYWLFLFQLRNIVLMDYNVSPDYVESLGKAIKTLETHGFDCRVMRSEMLMVGTRMKRQHDIVLAERYLIAKRTVKFEKQLEDLVKENEEEAELDKGEKKMDEITMEIEMGPEHSNKLQDDQYKGQGNPNKIPCDILEQEYVELELKRHKKMLAWKDEEEKRLDQVVEKINQFNQNKSGFSSGM